jgi:hypothetical protein
MRIQETAINKLRQLPDPLAHLVNSLIDALVGQSEQSPTASVNPEIPIEPFPTLKRVGHLWVAKAATHHDIAWESLLQRDRLTE